MLTFNWPRSFEWGSFFVFISRNEHFLSPEMNVFPQVPYLFEQNNLLNMISFD